MLKKISFAVICSTSTIKDTVTINECIDGLVHKDIDVSTTGSLDIAFNYKLVYNVMNNFAFAMFILELEMKGLKH